MSPIMALPSPTLVALFLVALPSLGTAKTADACTCFRTNETSAGYFTSHRFFDFRNVAPVQSTVPALISGLDDATQANVTSDFFANDAWTEDWNIQNWTNRDSMAASGATELMANSPSNIYIEKSNDSDPSYSTHLTLRTSRLNDFQTVSEFDSVEKNFQYLSARFMARVIGSPGACAGMFTYLDNKDPQKVQEADIEILTSGPRNAVQYTNQPSEDGSGNLVKEATVNGSQSQDWSQWNVYRLDWMPKRSSWYVNGGSVADITVQVPRDPAALIVNMWSNGGTWTGNMTLHDQAYLQIQWIQLAYNTSGPYAGKASRKRDDDNGGFGGSLVKRKGSKGCKVVCGIDEQVNITGTPAVLIDNTGMAPLGWKRERGGSLAWVPILLVAAVVFGAV